MKTARAPIVLVALACASAASCGGGTRPPTGQGGSGGSGGGGGTGFGDLRPAAVAAGKMIGTAVDAVALRDDPDYAVGLRAEFDYVTPENATKWGPLAPSRGVYDWAPADAIVDAAVANAQAIKGHTLVWHEQTPSWLTTAMTADEIAAALKQHIETTLAHFRGKMRAWDVVNEAISADTASGYTESLFWQKLGPRYIEDAFRWARAADPDVLLYYNEIGIERAGPKSDLAYALMRDLLAKGTPIDGIGFQSHVSIHRYPAESDLRANMRRFAELGLRVNISEADARTLMMSGSADSRWRAQQIAFQQIVGACVVEPSCEAITFWGFTDKYSWINAGAAELDDPLLLDRSYLLKPAHQGVLDGLAGMLPRRGDNLVNNGDFDAGQPSGEGWSASGGVLAVAAADGRAGSAACVSGRTDASHGVLQIGLLDRLAGGGPFSFVASARLRGTSSAPVNAELIVTESAGAPRGQNVATRVAGDGGWVDLAGYFGLGFTAAPTSIELRLSGPPAGVELCVAGVELRALSAR